jgi:hypothetical protein
VARGSMWVPISTLLSRSYCRCRAILSLSIRPTEAGDRDESIHMQDAGEIPKQSHSWDVDVQKTCGVSHVQRRWKLHTRYPYENMIPDDSLEYVRTIPPGRVRNRRHISKRDLLARQSCQLPHFEPTAYTVRDRTRIL